MKTTLTFETTDNEDTFEEMKIKRLFTTDDVYAVLWDVDQELRKYIKYGLPEDAKTEDGFVSLLEKIRRQINERVDFNIYP